MAKTRKRLRAQITVGHGPDGKPIYKWASGYTKKELEANKAELKRRHINGAVAVKREVLLGAYMTEWFDTYKKSACSRRTGRPLSDSAKNNLKLAINNYIFPAFSNRQMRAITSMDLQKFIDTALSGKGKTLIGDTYSALTNCFRKAYSDGVIDRDPSVALLKPQASEDEPRRALTDAETIAVRKLMGPTTDGLLLAILYYTGMRRGEALGLRWSDIDMRDGWIHIERDIDPHKDCVDTVKSEYSIRVVPIPGELYEILKSCRNIGNGYVVESPKTKSFLCVATFTRHWKIIRAKLYDIDNTIESMPITGKSDKAKKKKAKEHSDPERFGSILTPHYFRHNYASLLYNAGVDVMSAQRFLGHSDPTTTLRIYTHLAESTIMADAEKVKHAFGTSQSTVNRWQEIGMK